jgi:hypothetical protein
MSEANLENPHPRAGGDTSTRDSARMNLVTRGRASLDSRFRGNDVCMKGSK